MIDEQVKIIIFTNNEERKKEKRKNRINENI